MHTHHLDEKIMGILQWPRAQTDDNETSILRLENYSTEWPFHRAITHLRRELHNHNHAAGGGSESHALTFARRSNPRKASQTLVVTLSTTSDLSVNPERCASRGNLVGSIQLSDQHRAAVSSLWTAKLSSRMGLGSSRRAKATERKLHGDANAKVRIPYSVFLFSVR